MIHEKPKPHLILDKETLTGIEFMAILAPNQLPAAEGEQKADQQVETSYHVRDESESEGRDVEENTPDAEKDYTVLDGETDSAPEQQ